MKKGLLFLFLATLFISFHSITVGQTYTLSPVDGATDVSVTPTLTITFEAGTTVSLANNKYIYVASSDWSSYIDLYTGKPAPPPPAISQDSRLTVSGNTLTIDLSGTDLDYSQPYIVYVESDAILVDGVSWNTLSDYASPAWNFTTEVAVIPPTIDSVSPGDDATDVPVDQTLVITFDMEIQQGTGYMNIYKEDGSDFQTFNVTSSYLSFSGNQLTINHNDFTEGTNYYVQIPAGFVQSTTGLDFAGILDNATWNFSVITTAIPPIIDTLSPADGAVDVSTDQDLVITFDQNIQKGSGYMDIYTEDGTNVQALNITSLQITVSGNQLTINTDDFVAGTSYYVHIPAGFVQSTAGADFAGILDNTTWNFTAVDAAVPPLISTLSPLDNAVDVAVDQSMVITFDQDIQQGTGYMNIYQADGSDFQTFIYNSSSLTISGNQLTISHNDFVEGTSYYVEIPAGFVQSTSGADFAGILDNTTWNFLVSTPPLIESLSPMDDATVVSTNEDLVITFDKEIQEGIGYMTIYQEDGTDFQPFSASSSWITISGNQLIINANDFVVGTSYYVLMPAGFVKSTSGSDFAGILDNTTWNFTAVAAAVPPVIDTLSPLDDATDVTVDQNLVITFDQDIQQGTGYMNIYLADGSDFQTFIANSSSLTISGNQLTITHDDFVAGSSYYVEIPAGFVQSTSGVDFAGTLDNTTWNFTVINPLVIETLSPADDAVDVETDQNLIITFNQEIQTGTGAMTIYQADGTDFLTLASTSSRLTISGSQLTINPTNDFTAGTGYYVHMDEGFVKSTTGVESAEIADNTTWNFTTATVSVPPLIDTLSPADDAVDVAIDENLVITFDQDIQEGTGYMNIYLADGSDFQTFIANSSSLTISGNQLTISHDDFVEGTSYYVEIPAGFVQSTSGDDFAGIMDNTTWNFSVPNPPHIQTLSPADDAVDVLTTQNLVITFDQAIQKGAGYMNIYLESGDDFQTLQITSSRITISGSQLTINTNDFSADSSYYVLIPEGFVKSLDGFNFAGILDSTAWNFTVQSDAPIWADGYPNLSDQNASTLNLNGQTDMSGTYFYVVTSSSEQPTEAQIEAGLNQTGTTALRTGNGVMTADTPFSPTIVISSLTLGTDYYLHVVAKSQTGTYSAAQSLTIDRIAPALTSECDPTDGAIHVSLDQAILLQYSEKIYAPNGTEITSANAGSYFSLLDNNLNAVTLTIVVSTDGQTVTLTPTSDLLENITYQVQILILEDQYGNEQTASTTRTFTTDLTNQWSGNGDPDVWADPSNWVGNSYVDDMSVLIPASLTNYPNLTSDVANVYNLTVEPGAAITLSGGTLNITGLFTLESSAEVNASYLPLGGTLNVTPENVRFEQATSSSTINYNISSPVSGATKTSMGLTGAMYYYNNPTDSYILQDNTSSLETGRGYIFRIDGDVVFTGTPNSGSQTIDLVRTANQGLGWNLIGNPFSASILWDEETITKTRVENSFWMWMNQDGIYATYNGDTGLGVNMPSSSLIPSHQAFWVKVVGGLPNNTGQIIFPNACLRTNTTSYLKSGSTTQGPKYPSLKIAARLNGFIDETGVALISDATDSFKTDKLFSNNANYCELFTLNTDQSLAINGLPLTEDMEIDLGYSAKSTGPCELSIALNTLPENSEIFIKDKTNNTLTQITETLSYPFNIETVGKNTTRFALVLKVGTPTGLLDDVFDKDSNKPYIYTAKSEIVALIPGAQKANYQLFDTNGKLIDNGIFYGGTPYRIPVSQKGLVVLRVQWEKGITEYKAVF